MKLTAIHLFFVQALLAFCFLQKPAPLYPKTSGSLYVHIDKNVYMPGETIWFKAYLPTASAQHETLLVKIVDPQRKKVIIEREFAVYDIRAHGQIILPDSLATGTYQFMAYGNNNCALTAGNVFTQKISVAKNSSEVLLVKAALAGNKAVVPGNSTEIKFSLSKNNVAMAGIKGRFTVTSRDGTTTFAKGKLKTDELGTATATFSYPDIGPYEHVVVKGEFYEGNVPATANLYLPSQKNKVIVQAHVEGGQLVTGITNGVLVHLTDENDMPVPNAEVLLKEDTAHKLTIVTDSSGVGLVQFVPKPMADYSLATEGAAQQSLLNTGATLQLKLIDNTNLRVINTGAATQRRLQITSATGVLFTKQLNIGRNDSVAIVLPKVTTNTIISACLYDSKGMLTNQRLLVQGSAKPYKVRVTLDSPTIFPHQKVRASLHIEDDNGNPIKCNLSIAAVFSKDVDRNEYKVIAYAPYSGIAPQKQLKTMLQQPPGAINTLLMGYEWKSDTLQYDKCHLTAAVTGRIVPNRKDRPVYTDNFVLNTAHGPKIVAVDKDGCFTIPPGYLLAAEGQENYIIVNKKLLGHATIALDTVSSPASQLMALVADKPVYSSIYNHVPPNPIPGQMQLDEVVISKSTGGLSAAEYQKLLRDYPRTCNDYVCSSGVLNCGVHKIERGEPPVIGHRYIYTTVNYLYTHCIECDVHKEEKNTLTVKNISLPEPFPEMKFEGSDDVKYYSTIYWNPDIDTNENGDAVVEFTTSDLSGSYSLIIQGINTEDTGVIYGEAAFKVTAPQ